MNIKGVELLDTTKLSYINSYTRAIIQGSRLSSKLYFPSTNAYRYRQLSLTSYTTGLVLNFKRLRFFPLIKSGINGETFANTSLGILSKFTNKGKSFIRKKPSFLLVSSFIRRMLLFTQLPHIHLYINRTPLYFQEVFSSIFTPSKSIYRHPFLPKITVDESYDNVRQFNFDFVSFTNTRPYGYVKGKRKGRLKRKITKRVLSMNRVID